MTKVKYDALEVLKDISTMPTIVSVAKKHGISERTVRRIRDANPVKKVKEKKQEVKPVVTYEATYEWSASSKHITIYKNGHPITVNNSHINFKEALKCVLDNKPDVALALIDIKTIVKNICQGKVKIENDVVMYDDIKISNGLTDKIVRRIQDGEDVSCLVNFFEKLMENTSRRAVYELFGFLEHNDIEIAEDGDFIAWKRVNKDYTDIYTGKICNRPGTTVSVNRWEVDENPEQTCSFGLHVCAKSYLSHYASHKGTILQVKVNPKNVVAVPIDYNNAKMRVCEYGSLKDMNTRNPSDL
ncbi:MAG: homocysteine methyltransferase [Bacilli bacterium]